MSSRAVWILLVAATSCRGEGPPARERVLARLPASATLVIAADGRTLTQPRMRAVIDVLRPSWPERLGCAIDAALTADHVALGVTAARSAVLVLETRTAVMCPALSKVADRTWVATIGDATTASGGSVLEDPRFARARTYLATAPLALMLELPGGRAIAAATVSPFDGWLALDVHPLFADVIDDRVRAYVARLADHPQTAPFGTAIRIQRSGSQIVARLERPLDVDASLAVRTVIAWHAAPARHARPVVCPPVKAPVTACLVQTGRLRIQLASVTPILELLRDAPFSPVIENGMSEGLRLGAAIPLIGLEEGDVVIAIGSDRVTRASQVSALLRAREGDDGVQVTFLRDHLPTDLVLVDF
jgi:hypothetical protein